MIHQGDRLARAGIAHCPHMAEVRSARMDNMRAGCIWCARSETGPPDILKKRQTLLDDQKRGNDVCPIRRVPAAEIETAVIDQLRGLLRAPEIIIGTWRAASADISGLTEAEVRDALERLDPLWAELFL